MPDFEYELSAKEKGYKCICGVDEAGRGPLAGPVCAAAVILPENCEIPVGGFFHFFPVVWRQCGF